jgi:hypothetical protein
MLLVILRLHCPVASLRWLVGGCQSVLRRHPPMCHSAVGLKVKFFAVMA